MRRLYDERSWSVKIADERNRSITTHLLLIRHKENLHAASQDRSHNRLGICADVRFQRSDGTVSTYQSGFKSGRTSKAHGSTPGECMGADVWARLTVLGQR